MRLFYFLFFLYVVSHVYVFACLRRAFGGGKWQIPAALWLLAMAGSWLLRFGRPVGSLGEKFQDLTFFWMGFLILFCYCLLAGDVLALLARLGAWLAKSETLGRLAVFLRPAHWVPAAIAAGLCLYGYALYEAQHPQVEHVELVTDKLPPGGSPLRIVAVADVHTSSIIGPARSRAMAEQVAAQKPDILLMAGDLVDSDVAEKNGEASAWAAVPATLGKFAVTGNHEFYHGLDKSLSFMRRCGFMPLRGEVIETAGIVIAGVDDSNFKEVSPETVDVMRVLSLAPPDRFILLLNHKPYYPPEAVGRFDLQFSGHTHKGQIWPGELIVRHIFGHEQGLNALEESGRRSLLYITNGIGFWGPPVRFLAPPEITVITLRPPENISSAAP